MQYGVSEFAEIVQDETLSFQFLGELGAEEADDIEGQVLISNFYPHEIKLLLSMIAEGQPEVLLDAMESPEHLFPIKDPEVIRELKAIAEKKMTEE